MISAVGESLKNRDKRLEANQQQLGLGITALNKAMSLLLTNGSHIEIIKILSDSCRILADLHFLGTDNRIKLLSPNLDRSFLAIADKEDRDETLFGTNIGEKMRAAKAVEKQGQQLKKTVPVPARNTVAASHSRQGNWSAPPRFTYPPTRGGGEGVRG